MSWSLQALRRALSAWMSIAAERAVMANVLQRARQRSVWAALSTWHTLVVERAAAESRVLQQVDRAVMAWTDQGLRRALTSWASFAEARAAALVHLRRALDSSSRRAWLSWVSAAAERAAMARALARALHRSVWAAVSTWRDAVAERAAHLSLVAGAAARMSPEGRAVGAALRRWAEVSSRQQELSAFATSWWHVGARRALTSWVLQAAENRLAARAMVALLRASGSPA